MGNLPGDPSSTWAEGALETSEAVAGRLTRWSRTRMRRWSAARCLAAVDWFRQGCSLPRLRSRRAANRRCRQAIERRGGRGDQGPVETP